MSFTPIQRTDKHQASTYNLRLEEIDAQLSPVGSMEVLVDWTVTDSEVAAFDLTGISQDYTALLLLARLQNASSSQFATLKCNNDSAAGNHIYRDSSNLSSSAALITNGSTLRTIAGFAETNMSIVRALLVNYTATVCHIHIRAVAADNGGFTSLSYTTGGLYRNGPVNQIILTAASVFSAGSGYMLYGLKS
jgi:hypothetical protein